MKIALKKKRLIAGKSGNCFIPGGNPWESYKSWSGLNQLKELITLDSMLNKRIHELDDWHKKEYWDYSVADNMISTGLFTSLDYVLRMTKSKERFNLLAVVKEPTEDCKGLQLDGFDFVAYELLDVHYDISALTDCGGFDETFKPVGLNSFGLVENYAKAFDIKRRLPENNPEESHAITNVDAVWRHKSIGR